MSGKLINRRNFMKSSLASVAGFPLLASSGLKQEEKIEEKGGKKRKFIYRTLGKTGLKLPVVGMGAMFAMDPAIIRAALDSGIIHLETAHLYGGGKSEEIRGNNRRNDQGSPKGLLFDYDQNWIPRQ